jgi:hypothetical protein
VRVSALAAFWTMHVRARLACLSVHMRTRAALCYVLVLTRATFVRVDMNSSMNICACFTRRSMRVRARLARRGVHVRALCALGGMFMLDTARLMHEPVCFLARFSTVRSLAPSASMMGGHPTMRTLGEKTHFQRCYFCGKGMLFFIQLVLYISYGVKT